MVLLEFPVTVNCAKIDFTPEGKYLLLKADEVKPFSLDWVTARIVGKVPFLSWKEGIIACDLERVPKLAPLFAASVKGVRPFDFLTLRDVSFQQGALVGRVKIVI